VDVLQRQLEIEQCGEALLQDRDDPHFRHVLSCIVRRCPEVGAMSTASAPRMPSNQ
jgi:hypothetical protein